MSPSFRTHGVLHTKLSFACPYPCPCAASEQFACLLQSGYLGVNFGDQFGGVHGQSGMAYPRLRCAEDYMSSKHELGV
jgi:hypothetical protein